MDTETKPAVGRNDRGGGCFLCPRRCGAARDRGEVGFCSVGDTVLVARAALHFGEEPCLAGRGGVGAVFFGGCNLGCVFCQNRKISRGAAGVPVSVERLAELFLSLAGQGAEALDLVTPTPWVPQIREALTLAWDKGFWLPVVYNCGGYESVGALRSLSGFIAVYLPDFKYADPALGAALSRVPDYPARAVEALDEMVSQRGGLRFDGEGRLTRGVLVRHLVLPGHTDDSRAVIALLQKRYGDEIGISLMRQYTPLSGMTGDLARTLTDGEYREVVDFAQRIGVTNLVLQEPDAAGEDQIPAFNGEGTDPNPENPRERLP